jgi:hypothetical protein
MFTPGSPVRIEFAQLNREYDMTLRGEYIITIRRILPDPNVVDGSVDVASTPVIVRVDVK